MKKRKITNIYKVDFLPFDRYGPIVPKMSWHKISFDEKTGFGSFILKMDPGAKSTPHIHIGYEEFLVIDGELIDADNTIFKKVNLSPLSLAASILHIQKKAPC